MSADDTLPGPETQPVSAPRPGLLLVHGQSNSRATTALVLRQEGYEVAEAEGGEMARTLLTDQRFDVVLTDLKMETPTEGLSVLRAALEISPYTQVIVMTGYRTVAGAVEGMQRGAQDYISKPFKESELVVRVQRAVEKKRLLLDVTLFSDEFRERYKRAALVGRSAPMRELLARVVRVAPTDVTVLLTGESGTGKELIARAVHANAKRAWRPFVPVNCAAISETLLDSELFGHAKGAFTGAVKLRQGLFEEAGGGTFFFDEIAETTPAFQAKLLRVIQEHEIRRVGDNAFIKVDVRVIAATNQDLKQAIAEKRFREDLFYRLNVVPLTAPPLRERREDVPLLAQHFLTRFNQRNGTRRTLTQGALEKMVAYDFPGNVRELENIIEQEVDEAEKGAIEASVQRNDGQLERVARELDVSTTTLWRKMKRLGLRKE